MKKMIAALAMSMMVALPAHACISKDGEPTEHKRIHPAEQTVGEHGKREHNKGEMKRLKKWHQDLSEQDRAELAESITQQCGERLGWDASHKEQRQQMQCALKATKGFAKASKVKTTEI